MFSWLPSVVPFRSSSLPTTRRTLHPSQRARIPKHLSEIDGGPLANRTSVYLHLEQGLAKSPNQPAIICMHQPADTLSELLSVTQRSPKSHLGSKHPKVVPLCNDEQRCIPERWKGDDGYSSECLKISYTQLHHLSQDLAAGMLANGAQPESTILMLIPNGGEYGLLLWTSVIMRLTLVCADPSLVNASWPTELRELLRTLKPSLIVVADAASAKAVEALVTDLRLARPLRICLDNGGAPSGWKSLVELAGDVSGLLIDKDALLENARNDDPNRVHSILFTSGTSGRPKGCPLRVGGMTHVLHSQSWLIDNDACRLALQQVHPSRGIAPAQTLQTWRAGGAVVMSGRGFSVEDTVHAIRDYKVTFIVLTPALVHALGQEIESRPIDVNSVRSIQIGGDAVTKGVMMRCAALFPRARICVNHGMTEGGGSFIWPFFDIPIPQIPCFGEMCSVGTVAPGSIVRIWDADRKRLSKRGEPGALHICCGSTIRHYLGGASESSFYEDETGRWFNTGDIAIMDIEGLVFILGRSKDVIKRAGIAIVPAPLESCIEAYTGKATTVVAVPHPSLGSELFAVLGDFNGRHPEEIDEHIRRTCGKQYELSGVLSLRQIELDEFPVNATHKIMKPVVQKAVIQYLDRISANCVPG